MQKKKAAFAALIALAAAGSSHAAVYMNGAQLSTAYSNGQAVLGYQYDTNVSSGGTCGLYIDQVLSPSTPYKGMLLALTAGVNTFSYRSGSCSGLTSPNATLGLFFGTDAQAFNPASTARIADLLVSAANDSDSFFVLEAGTPVNNYYYGVQGYAHGFSDVLVGGFRVSVSDFTAHSEPALSDVTGTFSLTLTPDNSVPEPSTLLLSGLGALGMAATGRRRRKQG
jgi:hypothetical protein